MSQWTTVQHRLTFVAQQKAGKAVVQPTSSISFLNGIEHHRSTTFNMLNDLFNIQYSRMINYSTVADKKMLNSASLVVKLNFIHIGCFRACSGGGARGWGEENFPYIPYRTNEIFHSPKKSGFFPWHFSTTEIIGIMRSLVSKLLY